MLRAKETRRPREDKDAAIEDIHKPETKRLNAEIPVDLHRKLKVVAANKGKTVTELVIDTLHEHLLKYSNEHT
jgi:predicted HicB family RNase H-like nuclease